MKNNKKIIRRRFIIKGLQVLSAASFYQFLELSAWPKIARANTWGDLVSNLTPDGLVQSVQQKGQVYNSDNQIELGWQMTGSQAFFVGSNSQLTLMLPNGSLLQARANTRFDLFPAKTGSVVTLKYGDIMLLADNSQGFYPLLVHTDISDYGLRKGVFFIKSIPMGSSLNLEPEFSGVKEYSCLCNGIADLPSADFSRSLQSITGTLHNSFYLSADRKFKPAPLQFHDNEQIIELSKLLKNQPFDLSWLKG